MIVDILSKCVHKITLLCKGQIDLQDVMLDAWSYLFNLSRLQRRLRRKVFPIGEVICDSYRPSDQEAHQRFIYRYSAYARMKKKRREGVNDPLASCNLDEKNLFYVARYRDAIIGAVYLGYKCPMEGYSLWHLSGLAILKDYQGLGIATKLTAAVIEASGSKRKMVFLRVDPKNFRAIRLYKKLGFREDEALFHKIRADKSMGFPEDSHLFLFRVYR